MDPLIDRVEVLDELQRSRHESIDVSGEIPHSGCVGVCRHDRGSHDTAPEDVPCRPGHELPRGTGGRRDRGGFETWVTGRGEPDDVDLGGGDVRVAKDREGEVEGVGDGLDEVDDVRQSFGHARETV